MSATHRPAAPHGVLAASPVEGEAASRASEAAAGRILVWGGGGHGKVIADLVRALGYALVGYADRDAGKLGLPAEPGGGRVVCLEEELLSSVRERGEYPAGIDAVALAIGDNRLRERALRRLGALPLPALVHPGAVVSPSASLGRGSVVLAAAVVNADARIGEAVIVNSGAIVEHDCVLGHACHLSPGAVLGGGVEVGERSWVGIGAAVIPGVRIGADVTVGAGAVVIRDVPDGETVAGVPARPLRGRAPDG